MSRIGKLPVVIPEKVKVSINGTAVAVEGPKGKLDHQFPKDVKFAEVDGSIIVEPANKSRFAKAMYGTARAVIANMVQGVTEGYSKKLEISGVGFRAALKGRTLDMNLGYSHPVIYDVPEGVTVTVNENTKLTVEGINKVLVGQVAATIRAFCPPEPYKGKGIRIDGEVVRRKEGKTAGK